MSDGKPIQLISTNNNKFVLNNNALHLIENINGPIGVISVVGPYRTGKSFIMNRLLGRSNGFACGETYDSTTRGIWLWDTIETKYDNDDNLVNMLFLDTEVSNHVNSYLLRCTIKESNFCNYILIGCYSLNSSLDSA